MNVSADFSDGLIHTAYEVRSTQVASEISAVILKQIQDQQKREAEMLVQMINQTPRPSLDGTGQLIDVYV